MTHMSVPPMAAVGRLHVDVDSRSHFLATNLPFVVRDAQQAVVERGKCGATLSLAEGLYSVTVLTPTGATATKIVAVKADETSPLLFTRPASGPRSAILSITENAHDAPAPARQDPSPETPSPRVTLEAAHHCTHTAQGDRWDFEPINRLVTVPTAEFTIDDRSCVMSLPLNPNGAPPDSGCSVFSDTTGVNPKLRMTFASGRRVSRMVQGLVETNELAAASRILGEASELLMAKYSDPPGAALGGLTLHRLRMLRERADWVRNLANGFGWLPDGRILYAALLSETPDNTERDRGLDMLLAATELRPMYTDGLSLAMELLRRWPDNKATAERAARLDHLADYSSSADWNAINVTVFSPRQ